MSFLQFKQLLFEGEDSADKSNYQFYGFIFGTNNDAKIHGNCFDTYVRSIRNYMPWFLFENNELFSFDKYKYQLWILIKSFITF